MKLEFITSYPASLFYFVDRLSEWRRGIKNNEISKEFKPQLNQKQKYLLKQFSKIRAKYDYKIKDPFVDKRTLKPALKSIEKVVKPDEAQALKEIFTEYNLFFKPIFNENKHYLHANKQVLEKAWSPEEEKCFTAIKNFTNTNLTKKFKSRKILFVFAGGSQKNKNINAFALSNGTMGFHIYRHEPNPERIKQTIEVLVHELIHISYLKNGKDKIITTLYDKYGLSFTRSHTTMEAIVDCLAPTGLLTQDIFGTKPRLGYPRKKESIDYVARNMTKRLIFDLVKDYYEHKEKQDFWNDLLPKIVEKTSKQYP